MPTQSNLAQLARSANKVVAPSEIIDVVTQLPVPLPSTFLVWGLQLLSRLERPLNHATARGVKRPAVVHAPELFDTREGGTTRLAAAKRRLRDRGYGLGSVLAGPVKLVAALIILRNRCIVLLSPLDGYHAPVRWQWLPGMAGA